MIYIFTFLFLADLLEAGQETIETVLAWAFAILCARPDLQTRIQDEIDAFIKTNKRIPIFTDKGSLPFCVSTIKETLRYRAPTPLGGTHVLTKDGTYCLLY